MIAPCFPWVAPLLALAAGENLIHNGEARNANGWSGNGPAELFSHDRIAGAAGEGSLSIHRPAGADATPYNWFQRVELPRKTPRRLKLGVQVRASGFAPGSEACVMVDFGEIGDYAKR